MPKTFDERFLRFEFADTWIVERYDGHSDYREKIAKLQGSDAVDFVGLHGRVIFVIEVKDFRGHRIENKEKLGGSLAQTVAIKVRDSLAGVVAAHRMSSQPETWERLATALAARQTPLHVVLWLEDGMPGGTAEADARAALETQLLKRQCRWLTTKALVVGRHTHRDIPPQLKVISLPGAAGHARP